MKNTTITVFLAPDSILAERLDARDLYDSDSISDITEKFARTVRDMMQLQGYAITFKVYGDAIWRNQSYNCHVANIAKAIVIDPKGGTYVELRRYTIAFQRALDVACDAAVDHVADDIAFMRNLSDAYDA